jgi:hypothetical protein
MSQSLMFNKWHSNHRSQLLLQTPEYWLVDFRKDSSSRQHVVGSMATWVHIPDTFLPKYALLLHELTRLENKASPVTCENGYLCCSNTVQRAHGCCVFLPASFPTACIDSTAAISNCDNSCIDDFSTIKWYDKTNQTLSLSERFADLESTVLRVLIHTAIRKLGAMGFWNSAVQLPRLKRRYIPPTPARQLLRLAQQQRRQQVRPKALH